MRIWSIHLKYLDRLGLLGLWRETLQAKRVLETGEYMTCSVCEGSGSEMLEDNPTLCYKCHGKGEIKTPYYNHPQLHRFKTEDGIRYLKFYLWEIYIEATERGYNFNKNLIGKIKEKSFIKLFVSDRQVEYEFNHLQGKLKDRDKDKYEDNCNRLHEDKSIDTNPIFAVIEGDIEEWEKVK